MAIFKITAVPAFVNEQYLKRFGATNENITGQSQDNNQRYPDENFLLWHTPQRDEDVTGDFDSRRIQLLVRYFPRSATV